MEIMKTLNELYKKSCKPGNRTYKKITDEIILINNFFEDFDSARNFFISREKWKCIPYQDSDKPGKESIFPNWIGESLIEKYESENKIIYSIGPYDVECNFLSSEPNYVWSINNSCFFPHIDKPEYNGNLQYVCLINLNLVPIETKFYSFRDNKSCNIENYSEWDSYCKDIENELIKYYNKKNITGEEVKSFLDSKEHLDINLIDIVRYNSNQSIIYPANLFHCPNVTSEFSEENPRSLLRISFYQKVMKNNAISYS